MTKAQVKDRDEASTMMTAEISTDVYRLFKAKCAEKGETVRQRVEQLIREWLEQEKVRV